MPLQAKLSSADDAIALIASGDTVAFGGFGGMCHPELLVHALERRFQADRSPRDLTVVHAAGAGDWKGRGFDHLAHEGLVKRWVGGHFDSSVKVSKMAVAGAFEAYNLPQGVICQLYRDIAAGRPGNITSIGLETCIDPIHGGGKANDRTTDDLVERVDIGGRTWLCYKTFPIHVGLIRGWAADPLGNLVLDGEALVNESLQVALAAYSTALKPRRGLVIAQVRHLLDKPASPHLVRVPGRLVDRIVLAPVEHHGQTFTEDHNPAYCSPRPTDRNQAAAGATLPPGVRKIIAERGCDELTAGGIGNLGIGIPDGIGTVAAERGMLDDITLTIESGTFGGMPAPAMAFGASVHPHALIEQPTQFDFYDGRGLDFGALGFAEIDRNGNVNVSRFNNRLAGVGGFINISQTARKVIFCGAFTAGGLKLAVEGGQLRILQEGRVRKFVPEVQQISFSAKRSRQIEQQVVYITERAVFHLTADGLELTEIAPGIDLETQVLALMAFRPIIRRPRLMREGLFAQSFSELDLKGVAAG